MQKLRGFQAKNFVSTQQRPSHMVPSTNIARANTKMTAAALPRVDKYINTTFGQEKGSGLLANEPLTIMKSSDVDNIMWFVSASQTQMA